MAGRTLADAVIAVRPDFSKATAGADAAGRRAGQSYSDGFTRDADGKLKKAHGKFATDAQKQAHEAGGKSGSAFGGAYGGSFASTLKGFAGHAAGIMGALTASVTGVGLAGLVSFGIKSAASLEQAQVGFETLLGSGKKAQDFLKNLQQFAAATPFELPGLIDASRTLLGVGVSAKGVVPLLTAFGDAAGAVGVKQDAFQRIILATSQAISAGKFQVGDLNQIMTNGIPIYTILSKALHKPVPEIRALASHGKLLAKDVLPALQKEMEKDYGGSMAKQSKTLAGVWSTLKDNVAIGLANAIKPLVPMMETFLPKAANFASKALAGISGAIVAVVGAFKSGKANSSGFTGAMERVGVFIRDAVPVVRHLAVEVGTLLVGAFRVVGPAVASVVGWFSRHRGVAAALVGTIGALVAITRIHGAVLAVQAVGGLAKYIAQVGIVQKVTKIWAAVQWAIDAALNANPIALVVIGLAALAAGIIYAWKHSETFRTVVLAVWGAIKTAVGATVNWFTGTVWPALVAVWKGIANAVKWAWQNIIQPTVQALVAFFRGVVAPVFLWLWHNIVEPAWKTISWIVKTASAVIQLAVAIVVAYFKNVVAPVFLWLWHNIIQPVWHGIEGAVSAAVTAVRKTLTAVAGFLRSTFGPVFTWLWHNVIEPVWKGIRGAISAAWNFIRPILTSLGNFVRNNLVAMFKGGVSAISAVWDKLKAAAKAPVTFVVNSVVNPLIRGFNNLARVFHTPQVSEITGFAEGGRIPGEPSSKDNRLAWLKNKAGRPIGTLAVATGEFIVNARDTAKALPLLQWINTGMRGGPGEAARRIGRPVTEMPGDGSEGWAFASGGLVGFLKDAWGAISNPAQLIRKPVEAMIDRIPGGGVIRDVLAGMGHRLVDGLIHWVSGTGGTAPGTLGKAQSFVRAQDGKPYVWASAGPGGYDCSGIVSAVYNILKGHNPYSHTFSTESADRFFTKPGPGGPLVAAWSHPGQQPASASVGHMMGMVGGLTFESTGSRGVHLGSTTRRPSDFANIGHFSNGGLAKIATADTGYVTLERGWNLIGNNTGAREPLALRGSGGGDIHFHFHGPVASKQAAKDMVLDAYKSLVQSRRITPGAVR